jgi:hypothetical protein
MERLEHFEYHLVPVNPLFCYHSGELSGTILIKQWSNLKANQYIYIQYMIIQLYKLKRIETVLWNRKYYMDISGRPGPGPGMESATDGASLVFT